MSQKVLEMIYEEETLGTNLQVYGSKESPFFIADDVANWLEHSNPSSLLKKVDEDEKGINTVYTLGGPQKKLTLTENGVYEVLMQSRKPIAKKFKKKVKEILKQIRLTGAYIPIIEEETPDQFFARALVLAQETLKQKDVLIAEKEQQLIEQQPKVEFAEAIQATEEAISMHDFSLVVHKEIGIGRNKVLGILRDNKVFQNKKNHGTQLHNVPYAKYIDAGYFEVEEKVVFNTFTQEQMINLVTKITPKGQQWLLRKLKQKLNSE